MRACTWPPEGWRLPQASLGTPSEKPLSCDRPLEAWMRAAAVGQETGARYGEMMARYLGPVILRAFADDDVTEIYVNPQDGLVRFDTRSRGRIESGVSVAPPPPPGPGWGAAPRPLRRGWRCP